MAPPTGRQHERVAVRVSDGQWDGIRTWLSFRARHFRTISASAAARDSTVSPSFLRAQSAADTSVGGLNPTPRRHSFLAPAPDLALRC
jgi:hypothetical protein